MPRPFVIVALGCALTATGCTGVITLEQASTAIGATPGADVADVRTSAITEHSAWVEWRTETPIIGTVEYDTDGWPKIAREETATTHHRVVLDDMISGSRHGFRILTEPGGRSLFEGKLETASYSRGSMPVGWQSADLGPVSSEAPGEAFFDASADGGTFVVRGRGENVYYDEDSFHFVYQAVDGDFELTLKVNGYAGYLDHFTKAMTMFRAELTPGSAMINQSLNYNDLDYLYFRPTPGAQHENVTFTQLQRAPGAAVWARLRRSGDRFFEEYSDDGVTFQAHGPADGVALTLPRAGYVGFGVCSKSNEYTSEVRYTNVNLARR